MAIWQYYIMVLPIEEVKSYFGNQNYLNKADVENIDWWKYIDFEKFSFSDLKYLFPLRKSWSNEIMLFGSEDSNNIEIIHSNYKIEGIAIRIDLRDLNRDIIDCICIFFKKNNCFFINYKGKIINSNTTLLIDDIMQYNVYGDFLKLYKK